jgi:hypothetical protein
MAQEPEPNVVGAPLEGADAVLLCLVLCAGASTLLLGLACSLVR